VAGGNKVLVVRIPYCDCIVLKPQNMYEMGKTCYEMGNNEQMNGEKRQLSSKYIASDNSFLSIIAV